VRLCIVAVAPFSSAAVAAAFAWCQAWLLGRSVVVRPGPTILGLVRSWRVSVPVWIGSGSRSSRQLLVQGGVLGPLRALGF
jgi:hypothetical protein